MMNKTSITTRCWRWLARTITNQNSFKEYFEPLIQLLQSGWRADHTRARLLELRYESSDAYTLVLEPLGNWSGFHAGQFIELVVEHMGALTRRYFSISSAPAEWLKRRRIELTIGIQPKGKITPWLPKSLQIGDIVNIGSAMGEFILNKNRRNKLFIAGGTGITPFHSMLNQLSATADDTPCTLLYYAHNVDDFLFTESLTELGHTHSNLTIHFIETAHEGRFNIGHLQQYCADFTSREVYVCGPAGMMESAQELLEQHGLASEQLHLEQFGPPLSNSRQLTQSAQVRFTNHQVTVQVSAEKASQSSLLELAEENDLKPVFGCRMGVCHQCLCEKQSGVVYNRKTQQYSDTNSETIQLCISQPVGDVELKL